MARPTLAVDLLKPHPRPTQRKQSVRSRSHHNKAGASVAQTDHTTAPSPRAAKRAIITWSRVGLFLIILLALGVRAWNIENLPAGLYPDEATNAADAIRALETGNFHIFYDNNYGREGLFINLQALSLALFGYHIWSLKLWSIIFGTLTALGIYLLARELWQKRWVALIAAYFVATAFWAINFSRIGFRAIMVPFLLTFAVFFILKALRTKRHLFFLLGGLMFGLGIHTYIAFRVAPFLLVIFLFGLMLSYKGFLKIYWRHALTFVLGAFIAAAPMFYDFTQHPDHFISRSSSISIFEPAVNHGHFWETLTRTFGLSLAKYTFYGDQNWRHNYPPYPLLDPLTGFCFLIGFFFLVRRFGLLLYRRLRRQERNKELAHDALLLGWFFVMLMPEFLTDEGLPHALRAIGTLPVVFLIAALPFLWIGERFAGSSARVQAFITTGVVIGLSIVGVWNISKYHIAFAEHPDQYGAFNANFTNMAAYLQALPPETHKYVLPNAGGTEINNGLPVTAQPILFLTYAQVNNFEFIHPETLIREPAAIVLMRHDDRVIEQVRARFPQAFVEHVDVRPGYPTDFTVIKIPVYIPTATVHPLTE